MKRKMNVQRNQIMLAFDKLNECQTLLSKGSHWVSIFTEFETIGTNKALPLQGKYESLITFASKTDQYSILNLKASELAFIYRNGLLSEVLAEGVYAVFKTDTLTEVRKYSTEITEISGLENLDLKNLNETMLSMYTRKVEINANENALLFFNGVFIRLLQSGIYYFWKNSVNVTVARIDLRNQNLEVNGQELLSKDKVQLRINLNINFRVVDAVKAVNENKDHNTQLYTMAQIALRKMVALVSLDELLNNKDNTSEIVMEEIRKSCESLGIVINSCNIKDIILPGEVRNIMNKVLIAEKNALANAITRREETSSTRSLLNTAKLMEENSMLMKLKEMEFIERITDKMDKIGLNSNENILTQLRSMLTGN